MDGAGGTGRSWKSLALCVALAVALSSATMVLLGGVRRLCGDCGLLSAGTTARNDCCEHRGTGSPAH